MCKRSVENYEQELKRQRNQYTQGPLDLVFGQHRAFPQEDSDLPVWAYLADVRTEAENDRTCHFVTRTDATCKIAQIGKTTVEIELQKPTVSSRLCQRLIEETMDRLMREKQAWIELTKSSDVMNDNGEIQLNIGDIDFSVGSLGDEDNNYNYQEEEMNEDYQNEDRQNQDQDQDRFEAHLNQDQLNSNDKGVQGLPHDHLEQDVNLDTDQMTEKESTTVPLSAAKWRQLVFGNPPPSQEYFHKVLEHPTVIKLMVYYSKWLLATMPPTVGQWIFSTFVRLDNGLDHRELAIVRDLGRKALKLRQKAVAANVSYNPIYDMILAVVGNYFGQKDLLL